MVNGHCDQHIVLLLHYKQVMDISVLLLFYLGKEYGAEMNELTDQPNK